MVKVLIVKGMDINERVDGRGDTALMLASLRRDSAMVRFLLNHPSLRCINDQTHYYGRTALLLSCMKDHNVQVTKLLLEAGVDPRITSRYERSPLEWTTAQGNQDVVHLLEVRIYGMYVKAASFKSDQHLPSRTHKYIHTNTTECLG